LTNAGRFPIIETLQEMSESNSSEGKRVPINWRLLIAAGVEAEVMGFAEVVRESSQKAAETKASSWALKVVRASSEISSRTGLTGSFGKWSPGVFR
jgi:5-formaminoimidazole-4-carboxamide-1-beta-D-ribofuranosyl 5'-monophosphate synthetase